MTITQNLTSNVVTSFTITSDLLTQLSTFVDNKLKIRVLYACGDESNRTITSNSGNTYLITPSFLGLTSFQDGVYQVILEGITTTNTVTDEKCTFIDVDLKCKVSTLVAADNIEAGILYYTLKQAQTCDCACENLCTIFCKLNKLLNTTDGCC